MPEAPEVEAVARALRPLVAGRTIRRAEIIHSIAIKPQTPEFFASHVRGQRIRNVTRHGKYLILELSVGVLVLHFKFDGQLFLLGKRPAATTHTDVLFTLDRGYLGFVDPRHLGRILWYRDASASPGLAGIGNIYSNEILWRARINPKNLARRLSPAELHRLHNAVGAVLQAAVRCCSDPPPDFRNPDWWFADLGKILRVYQREGRACRRCGSQIRRIEQAGRSTYFCPRCQR